MLTLVRLCRHYWRSMVASVALTTVAAFAEAGALVAVVPIANAVSAGENRRRAWKFGPFTLGASTSRLLFGAAVLVLISMAGKAGASWVRARFVALWELRQRVRVAKAYLASDYEVQSRLNASEIQEIAGNQVTQAVVAISAVSLMLNAVLTLAVLVATAFVVEPIAVLGLVAVSGVSVGVLRPLKRAVRAASRRIAGLSVQAAERVSELATSARDIRVFGIAPSMLKRYRSKIDPAAVDRRSALFLMGLSPALYQGLGLIAVLGALAFATTRANTEVASFGAAALLLLRSLAYGQQINASTQSIHQSLPFVERLQSAIEYLEASREVVGDAALKRVDRIELLRVGYTYGADSQPALSDIDLVLERPGIVGLVGPSGSGKSTLAHLILRLRHPREGQLLVNGLPAWSYSSNDWARRFSLVPQEPKLFDGTVSENITLFRDTISFDKTRLVARAVGLDEFFSSLPNGYDTQLGDTERELSGGQRQRLAIARALAGGADVIVLDEPTSALDAESERWIHAALRIIAERSLVVVITHRPSTAEICTRTVELRGGRLVEVVPDPVSRQVAQ